MYVETVALSSFAKPWQRRCRAVLAKSDSPVYYGRCELRAGHKEAHTIERGMEILCWAVARDAGVIRV